jgi:hypothetical protein
MLLCDEDRPLSAAEATLAATALAALPAELRESAFRGGSAGARSPIDADASEAELSDLVARCVRGERPAPRALFVLRSTLQWRADVGADTVRAVVKPLGPAAAAWPLPCAAAALTRLHLVFLGPDLFPCPAQLLATPQPGADAFHAAWPGSVHGQDAAGHVVFLESMSSINLAALAALSPAQLVAGRAQAMEALQRHKRSCAPAARVYSQHVYVLDCAGASSTALLSSAARRVVRSITGVSTDCYTGTLYRCHVINVHPSVRLAWRALSPLLHPETAAKVALHGGPADYLPAMAREGLPASALPPALGGTHKGGATLQALIARGLPGRAAFARSDSASDMHQAGCGGRVGTAARAGKACAGDGCSAAVASFLIDARARPRHVQATQ